MSNSRNLARLQSNSIGKLANSNMSSGSIINVSYFENSTKQVFSNALVNPFGTLNITKLQASSYLLIDALVMTKGYWSYANNWSIIVNGTSYDGRGGWNDTSNGTYIIDYTRGTRVGPLRVPNVSIGSVQVTIYFYNGDSGYIESIILNPNNTNDSRYKQQVSSIYIMEISG